MTPMHPLTYLVYDHHGSCRGRLTPPISWIEWGSAVADIESFQVLGLLKRTSRLPSKSYNSGFHLTLSRNIHPRPAGIPSGGIGRYYPLLGFLAQTIPISVDPDEMHGSLDRDLNGTQLVPYIFLVADSIPLLLHADKVTGITATTFHYASLLEVVDFHAAVNSLAVTTRPKTHKFRIGLLQYLTVQFSMLLLLIARFSPFSSAFTFSPVSGSSSHKLYVSFRISRTTPLFLCNTGCLCALGACQIMII